MSEKLRDYCMTLVRKMPDGAEQHFHMHAEAPDRDAAVALLLHQCITQNISIVGCELIVVVPEDIDPLTVRYVEKARLLNHGHDAPVPSTSVVSGHLH